MKLIAMFILMATMVFGCQMVPVSQQDLQQAAQRALEQSIRASFTGASNCYWTVSGLRLEEGGERMASEGFGKITPVAINAKVFACGFTGGASPRVTYAALDQDLSIEVYRNAFGSVEYRTTGDRSRPVKTDRFSCGGSVVNGIVDSIDVGKCSVNLTTGEGTFSASIPDSAIAELLAKKFKPGLAVSLYLDSAATSPRQQRAVYLEVH